MTTPCSDEKTEEWSTYNYAARVLGFKVSAPRLQGFQPPHNPASPQHSFGFGLYFQGEAQSMSLVPPAFTPNATLLKTPKGTNDIPGGLIQ